jgi:gas vesicle protein
MRHPRRRTLATITVAPAIALAALTACGDSSDETEQTMGQDRNQTTAEDVQKEASEAMQAGRQWAADSYEDARNKLEDQWNALSRQVAQMREQGEAKSEQAMEDVQQALDNAEARWSEFKDQGADAWEEMSQGVRDAFDDLEKAYERAKEDATRSGG